MIQPFVLSMHGMVGDRKENKNSLLTVLPEPDSVCVCVLGRRGVRGQGGDITYKEH